MKLSGYTIAQKYEVLQLTDKGVKPSKVAKDLAISKNNTSTWTKPEIKQKILKEYESALIDSSRKRLRDGKYSDVEKALFTVV